MHIYNHLTDQLSLIEIGNEFIKVPCSRCEANFGTFHVHYSLTLIAFQMIQAYFESDQISYSCMLNTTVAQIAKLLDAWGSLPRTVLM